ncbi:ribosome biogenesis protein NOP53 [Pleurodeles waltl]|uniref:ribosome biogenesis protein NOP53 n=1 Tax=Pleurodeles waltl TaxID=8319 RepID=UPI0037095FB6
MAKGSVAPATAPTGFLGLKLGAEHRVPGAKKKRLNRNKKKTWKRHIDARDVEEFLQDVQMQERTHGGLVAEKPDETLYFMDTGNEDKDLKITRGKAKPLRIDLILQTDSKVAPPKNILSHQIPNSRKLKRKKQLREKLERRGIIPRKQRLLQAKLLMPPREPKPAVRSHPGREFYDIWTESNPLDDGLANKDKFYLEQTKKYPVKRPDRMNAKPSQLPAVEVISSGGSYNPTFESHQALLLRAHEVELKRLKEEEKLKKQLSFPTIDQAPTSETVFRELCQGLLEDSDDEEFKAHPLKAKVDNVDQEEDDDEEEEVKRGAPTAKAVTGEKKTERQRKREKREKALVARRQAEKALRLKKQEVFKLRSIRSEMKQREDILVKRKEKRIAKHKAEATQPRRLGRLKYEDPDTDVQLSEELAGSLRALKPEGSILKDRFKSLQKRNLIEPRERAKFKRRHKVKYVEKRAFREVTL